MKYLIGLGVLVVLVVVLALTKRVRRRHTICRRLEHSSYEIPSFEIVQALRRNTQREDSKTGSSRRSKKTTKRRSTRPAVTSLSERKLPRDYLNRVRCSTAF